MDKPLAGNHAVYWGVMGPTCSDAVSGSLLLNMKREIKIVHN